MTPETTPETGTRMRRESNEIPDAVERVLAFLDRYLADGAGR